MALRYLDNALGTGANNGTSWANAWQSIGAMSGLAAGDTVYISAPDGGTQTYSFSDVFPTVNGSSGGGRITYQIGQDVGHRGTVIFNQTSVGFSNGALINGASYMNFIGDAGDGLKHFQLSGTLTSLLILQGTDTNVRMAYFDMGTFVGRVGSVNPGTHIELDHIDGIFPGYLNMDAALIFNVTGSTWDENLVHDCDWDIPWNSTNSNNGSDGVKPGGGSYSIYNMNIHSTDRSTFMTTEHSDGIQALGPGSFIKAYNNRFTNMSNYGNYWEATNGVFNHLWVYNNIASVTNSNLGTHSSGGFVVEQKIAGTMNDIVLANNTVVDLQPVGSRAITMLANGNGTYTNSVLANNLLVNSNTVERDAGTPTPSGNVNITGANAATYLVSYTLYGGSSNNLHLTSAASTVIGAGADLSAYFTVDKDGLTRTAPWDVGAFKYVAAGGAGGSQMAGKISLSGKVTIK